MPLQFELYSPKFINKLAPLVILPFLKLRYRGTQEVSLAHHLTVAKKSHYAFG